MMSLQEEKVIAPVFFKEYINGTFRLNIGEYNYPLILSSKEVLDYQEKINDLEDIQMSHLELILKSYPEIVIIGTGKKQVLPPVELISELAKKGKSIDFMASDVACKTYNLLVNENRNVSCIII
ncbi:membrane protein [Francisella halioticida]|uniref:13 kDa major membrane protein n=1 Tax=Francisella halioticida TaxID=549298 RepID=A0ABM6M1C8_9GAMM|nr:Mth938-like domain-containing protein [Francisella halioticida]ASG68626.1 hypothetical protein CDV26_09660 [Francisella halioticida]BCD91539.1 membrane protein [Francisella halioticida]